MGRCDGKVAFITGAGRGQGRAHAVGLAREGASIIALDAPGEATTAPYALATVADLEETTRLVEAEGGAIVARAGDVRDRASVQKVLDEGLEQFGHVDYVVPSAGIGGLAPATEMTDELWQDMIDTNLTGPWNTAAAAIPHMIEAGNGGAIVFTSSMAGVLAVPNAVHYTAAKHGVIGVMRTLANELAPHNIRCTAICPSTVRTPMIQNENTYRFIRPDLENPTMEDAKGGFTSFTLLKDPPWMEPEDVTETVLYLVGDSGRFMTGAVITLDAGASAKFPAG